MEKNDECLFSGLRCRSSDCTAFSLGCAQDSLSQWCTFDESSFDIEEVSVLEDAMGEVSVHDAIVLEYDTSNLSAESTWRVGTVEALIMVPQSQFDIYPDNITLTVEVFDASDPRVTTPWVVEQSLDKSSLNWEAVTLTSPVIWRQSISRCSVVAF